MGSYSPIMCSKYSLLSAKIFLNLGQSSWSIKLKTEKQIFSLDIFVSDTSIARNLHFPGLEKKHFSHKTWAHIESGPITEVKKISALINYWENIITYCE